MHNTKDSGRHGDERVFIRGMKIIDIMEITKNIQDDQIGDMSGFGIQEIMEYTKNSRYAYTAVLSNGTPIASFGVNEHKDGVSGTAWGVVSLHAGKHFISVHRAVQEFLDRCEYDTVYMTVREGFVRGNRWAKMLGFKFDRILENWRRDSGNAVLYRRTK